MADHVTATSVHVAPRTTIRVNLKSDVKLESLTTIIGRIGGRYGCLACGLLGFDLQLVGDPGDFKEIAGLEGVKSIEV